METARKDKLMIRWSLATAGAIAIFWTIWYLVAGNVPVVTSIGANHLRFGISRWWDILIGPIWSTMIVLLFTSEPIREVGGEYGITVGGLVGLVSLIVALIFGVFSGFALGLLAGSAILLVCGALIFIINIIRSICSTKFCVVIGNWLLAKD